MVHSSISSQMGLSCSNQLYPIQKTSGNLCLLQLLQFLQELSCDLIV